MTYPTAASLKKRKADFDSDNKNGELALAAAFLGQSITTFDEKNTSQDNLAELAPLPNTSDEFESKAIDVIQGGGWVVERLPSEESQDTTFNNRNSSAIISSLIGGMLGLFFVSVALETATNVDSCGIKQPLIDFDSIKLSYHAGEKPRDLELKPGEIIFWDKPNGDGYEVYYQVSSDYGMRFTVDNDKQDKEAFEALSAFKNAETKEAKMTSTVVKSILAPKQRAIELYHGNRVMSNYKQGMAVAMIVGTVIGAIAICMTNPLGIAFLAMVIAVGIVATGVGCLCAKKTERPATYNRKANPVHTSLFSNQEERSQYLSEHLRQLI